MGSALIGLITPGHVSLDAFSRHEIRQDSNHSMRRRIGKVQQDVSFAVGGWRFQTTECVPDDEPMSCLYEYLTDVQNPPLDLPRRRLCTLAF